MRRPSRFVFFCGGSAGSLRHYLLNDRKIGERLKGGILLAEKANELYRDSEYEDLISFEEDIAQISSLVLLIAESAGSLAELGAFASIEAIRDRLAVIIQTEYEGAESFVRFGPIERIKNDDDRRVGAFPWRLRKNSTLIRTSIKAHVREVVSFINGMILRTPSEELFKSNERLQSFIIILWILHMSAAISITDLLKYADEIFSIPQADVKNKLYCMKMCGWIGKYRYSGKDYWFSRSISDPISKYRFVTGTDNNIGLRKPEVASKLTKDLGTPRHVREYVAAQKVALP